MFRQTADEEYEAKSAGGTRYLFRVGHFEFLDTIDAQAEFHRFVLELNEAGSDPTAYEADPATMYELMARYLAGEYEKEEYNLDISPAHDALLDALELLAARSRSGETDITLGAFDEEDFEDDDLDEEFDEDEDEDEDEDAPGERPSAG
ncbi:MAG TPA: hypothetical protein VE913_22090 [Longimicrobium sp.]|nr:hypothetical protein [Longimicrobium sp.]